MGTIHFGAVMWTKAWVHMQTLLRANLLTAQVASGGPEAGQPVGSAGEAMTHFRDDTEDVAMLVDGMVDVSGGLVFTVAAGFLLGAADAVGAAVLLVPLIGVVLTTKALDGRIKAVPRRRPRGDGGGHRSGRRHHGGGHDGQGQQRRPTPCSPGCRASSTTAGDTAVRDRVLDEGVMAFSQGAADVGLGLVLLVSAGALASGAFDVGTLALFVAYLGWLELPAADGRAHAGPAQAGRRSPSTACASWSPAATPPTPCRARVCRSSAASAACGRTPTGPARVPLERLDVVGLSARYPGGAGVHDVSFTMQRGELRRAHRPRRRRARARCCGPCSGLSWQADVVGEVRWNGDAARRPRRVPGAAERGVPAAGAAARLRLGARQRRARTGRRRRPRPGAVAGRRSPTTSRQLPDGDRTR